MSILMRYLGIFLLMGLLSNTAAWGAGPFTYHLPRGAGLDLEAVTVVGEPQTHHLVRYENLYGIARQYGSWPTTSARWTTSICPGKLTSPFPPNGSSRSGPPTPAI
jgi:hypothetical protein